MRAIVGLPQFRCNSTLGASASGKKKRRVIVHSRSKPTLPSELALKRTASDRVHEPDLEVYPQWLKGRKDFQEFRSKDSRPMTPNICEIYQKPLDKRKPHELRAVAEWLGSIPFFQGMKPERLEDFVGMLFLVQFRAGAVVYSEGMHGDCMFVIYSGEVGIYVDGQEVRRCGPKALVGERAFFGDAKRTATVRALSELAVLKIQLSFYENVLFNEKQRETQKLTQFLSHLPIISHWPLLKVKNFASSFHVLEYKPGEMIFNQNDEAHSMYIVFSGLVAQEVLVEVPYSHCWPKAARSWERVFAKNLYTQVVADARPGRVLGATDLIKGRRRQAKATAKKNTTVFMIPNHLFFEYFTSEDQAKVLEYEQSHQAADPQGSLRRSLYKVRRHSRGLFHALPGKVTDHPLLQNRPVHYTHDHVILNRKHG